MGPGTTYDAVELRKAATLTEPFPRPRTGDRGYRHDTVVVSAIWHRGKNDAFTANRSKIGGAPTKIPFSLRTGKITGSFENLPLLRAVISSPLIMETTSIIGQSGVLSTFGCLLAGG
jgi:hypothetical protein